MTNFIVDNILNIFKKEENKQEIKNLLGFYVNYFLLKYIHMYYFLLF